MKINIPPIKTQRIKTKLIPEIVKTLPDNFDTWVEPFSGSCIVGLNLAKNSAIFADTNPHIVNFYNYLKSLDSVESIRDYLESSGSLLKLIGEDYYYYVRDSFNACHLPNDFLFLNRSCFNGLIRFNRKGEFNTPFCRKPERFSKAYITKIVNQCEWVIQKTKTSSFKFSHQPFEHTIEDNNRESTIIYCDPPYINRHSTYYDTWNESEEYKLFGLLSNTKAKFILSAWIRGDVGSRENPYISKLWNKFNIREVEHFYHVGAKEKNRGSVIEGLITNF